MKLFPKCRAGGYSWSFDAIMDWCETPGNLHPELGRSEIQHGHDFLIVCLPDSDKGPEIRITRENRVFPRSTLSFNKSNVTPTQWARMVIFFEGLRARNLQGEIDAFFSEQDE